jgi:hypothetical protein
MLSYAGSTTCKLSGVHHLDTETGKCVLCGEPIVKTAAAVAETMGKKKGASVQAHPFFSRLRRP